MEHTPVLDVESGFIDYSNAGDFTATTFSMSTKIQPEPNAYWSNNIFLSIAGIRTDLITTPMSKFGTQLVSKRLVRKTGLPVSLI